MGNNEFTINNHFDTDMLNMDPLASTERTWMPGGRGVKNWQNFADVFYGPLVTFYNTNIGSHKNGRCDFLRMVVKCHPDGNVVANM